MALKIKQYREQAGMKQDEVSRALGISINTYRNYEYAFREPTVETIKKLADLFGCSVDDLVDYQPPVERVLLDVTDLPAASIVEVKDFIAYQRVKWRHYLQ